MKDVQAFDIYPPKALQLENVLDYKYQVKHCNVYWEGWQIVPTGWMDIFIIFVFSPQLSLVLSGIWLSEATCCIWAKCIYYGGILCQVVEEKNFPVASY